MRCPFCKHADTKVTDSRATDDGRAIRRRRECHSCGRRFTTYEMVEEVPLYVVKKDGRRELFDRNKILNGLLRACNKRRVTRQQLDEIVAKVERNIRNTLEQEIPSVKIGEMILDELQAIDSVAYIRFASVYRQFADLDSFMAELKRLMANREGKPSDLP
ncbi:MULTISPECIES: transcriptional regulator NrdR [Megasphaera]|uniref:Transcriptional repressor NrdR n=1 Tax=Megasphaera vaginalis (ex Srinivasan et al. 2021) TaxID=1111454 RepID=U7URA6_9FIRM|nr:MULTISPECIES: transcriptional regulator NrdR [Megasphaera]ERT61816.1 transcriptional regulator NrdR [Megasphaera vaginalis (ex Srinivasan et al. 2021)]